MPLLTRESANPPTTSDVPNIWVFDGSWRDIYVLNTDVESWKQFLIFVATLPHTFEIDRNGAAMPDLTELLGSQDHAYLLSIKVGDVALNCHFFDEEQIELDVDPREVRGPAEHDGVFAFMAVMAEVVKKSVILTPENEIENPLVSYEPSVGKWRWRTD
jgi:hypothetical protein